MTNASSPFAQWSTAKPLCFNPFTTNEAIFLSSSTTSTRIEFRAPMEAEFVAEDKPSGVIQGGELMFRTAQRVNRAIKPALFARPPCSRGTALETGREAVFVNCRAHIERRGVWKWILLQQREDRCGALEKANKEANEPAVEPVIA